MPLIALAILLVLAVIVLIPFSLVQRFRVGTARRRARGWVATLNVIAFTFSVLLFLAGAAITSVWIPAALAYTFAGLGVGFVLGLIGVALTRWDSRDGWMSYTPNRVLVLGITTLVAARVLYGFWRGWETWRASVTSMTWIAASELSASMSAGAVVLCYYLVFWAGVRWRIARSR